MALFRFRLRLRPAAGATRHLRLSTKNLARTVIEGGRTHYNQFERRHSLRKLRARSRQALDRVGDDLTLAEGWVSPRLQPVSQQFSDKLGPAMRWLRRHVGQRWDAVFAELRVDFDPRTIAGRHIVYDHMVPWVDQGGPRHRFGWGPPFFVDDAGVLRSAPPRKRTHHRWVRDARALEAWLEGRRVAVRGGHHFWLVPTVVWKMVQGKPEAVPTGRYRQARALDADEARRFLAFSTEARQPKTDIL